MITREEALKVVKQKSKKQSIKCKEIADKAIERISNEIRKGRFSVPNVGKDPEVLRIITKAFEQEGFKIEYYITKSQVTGKKSRKTTQYEVNNLKVSIE